jgi:hypothetical protein
LFLSNFIVLNHVTPFLNIFFTSLFVSVLLLFIMVISHSVVTVNIIYLTQKPKNRTFCFFYLPKLIVVVLVFILLILTFGWERYNQLTNVGFSMIEIPFFGQLRVMILTVLFIVLFFISYYVIRALGDIKNNNSTHSPRFKGFIILTFIVLLVIT